MPAGIHTRAGSMTELPFDDGFFDGAYATESLEHAVEIEKAVAEMCRVVKPGGRIAIIDKNAEHWGRLETPEWEKWFTRKELERLLARHCREVSSRRFPIGKTSSRTVCSWRGWRRNESLLFQASNRAIIDYGHAGRRLTRRRASTSELR